MTLVFLVFLVAYCGICFVARVSITVIGLVWSSVLPLSYWFVVAIYLCAFSCGGSLTVRSVWGILFSFRVF